MKLKAITVVRSIVGIHRTIYNDRLVGQLEFTRSIKVEWGDDSLLCEKIVNELRKYGFKCKVVKTPKRRERAHWNIGGSTRIWTTEDVDI